MSKGNKKNTENGGKRMNDISVTNGISGKNKERVIEWTNSRGADFLAQWAGPKLAFPLTQEQFEQMENLYSVFHDGAFIGMIQKIKTENNNVHIGRFIIDPEQTGKGFGKEALLRFMKTIFSDKNIHSITLTVSDTNAHAKRLYEKVGFKIKETVDAPAKKFIMIAFAN